MEWPVFDDVPVEDVRQLLAIARRRRFDRHEVVFHQGDPADSLHLISGGRFAVRLRTQLGDEVLVDICGVGDVFGQLALVGREPAPRVATLSALERSETLCVYRDDFERLRGRHPPVNRTLVALLAEQLRRTDQRLLEAHYLDVDRRVARRLLDLCRIYPDSTGGATIPLTQEELAALAGATRPSVNKALRHLEQRGAITLQRGKLIVHDSDLVAKSAQ